MDLISGGVGGRSEGEGRRWDEQAQRVLAALGKTDLFRTHEVPRIKAVLDTLNVY